MYAREDNALDKITSFACGFPVQFSNAHRTGEDFQPSCKERACGRDPAEEKALRLPSEILPPLLQPKGDGKGEMRAQTTAQDL